MLSNCRHNICCCRIASQCSYNSCSFSGITGWLGRVGVLGSPVAISVAVGGGTVLACSSTMSLLPSASSCSSGACGASGGGRSKEWLLPASSMSSGVGGGFLHHLLLTYRLLGCCCLLLYSVHARALAAMEDPQNFQAATAPAAMMERMRTGSTAARIAAVVECCRSS